MWILLFNVLWGVPVAVFLWARSHSPQRICCYTGAAFGLVVGPAGMALYGLYFINPVTAPLGILGLIVTLIHDVPGYQLALSLGLVEQATVVSGVQHVCTTVLTSLVWTPIYAVLGFALDWPRLHRERTA